VVLLAHGAPEAARSLAERGLVDVVIDTNLHRSLEPPFRVGEAIWVKSHFQTMRLGELRLGLEGGRIAWARDRKIDMDEGIPPQNDARRLEEAARRAVDALMR